MDVVFIVPVTGSNVSSSGIFPTSSKQTPFIGRVGVEPRMVAILVEVTCMDITVVVVLVLVFSVNSKPSGTTVPVVMVADVVRADSSEKADRV